MPHSIPPFETKSQVLTNYFDNKASDMKVGSNNYKGLIVRLFQQVQQVAKNKYGCEKIKL